MNRTWILGCWILSQLLPLLAAEPVINTVSMDASNIVVSVTAPAGVRKISLEGRARAEGSAWAPRAVHRFEAQLATATLVEMRLLRSENLEIIRVRADANEPLPPGFFKGTNQFASPWGSDYSGSIPPGPNPGSTTGSTTGTTTGTTTGSTGATTGGATTTATSTGTTTGTTTGSTTGSTTGTTTGTPTAVVESDIWKIFGDTLYFFNQRRGLQLINIADPATPAIKGTFPMPSVGEQMYVLPNGHAVLLSHAPCFANGASVSQTSVTVVDAATMNSTGQISFDGAIKESRLVGNILYAAVQIYRPQPNTSNWEFGVEVVSVDLGNSSPVLRKTLWIPGKARAISATDQFLFVAMDSPSSWIDGEVQVIDISSPSGDFAFRSKIATAGQVHDKFKMNLDGEIFSTVSYRWETALGWVTTLENFSLANASAPEKLGSLNLAKNEQLFATRFDGKKVYIVTYRRIDPLWIVDNTDPAHPSIKGELHVPGWSTYIRPMGDRLVAMGKDDTNGLRVAVSLFDVANAAAPALLSKVIMGTNYTWSEANSDEKAMTILPEDGLILAPWSGVNGQYMQLIDLTDNTLTARAALANQIDPRRATLHRGHILSLSSGELNTYTVADRDHPQFAARLSLAWRVDRAMRVGEHLLQIENGWGRPSIRISSAANPEKILASVSFDPSLSIAGIEARDNKLYVAAAHVLNNNNGTTTAGMGGATTAALNPNQVVLSVWDLSALPNLQKISEVSASVTSTFSNSLRALWPKPGLLVWAADEEILNHFNGSSTTTGGGSGTSTTTGGFGTGLSTGMTTGTTTGTTSGHWIGTTTGTTTGDFEDHGSPGTRFVAFDVTQPGAPIFKSEVVINFPLSHALLSEGLIFASHARNERILIPGPPSGWNGGTTTGSTTGTTGGVDLGPTVPSALKFIFGSSLLGSGWEYSAHFNGGNAGTFTNSPQGQGQGTFTFTRSGDSAHLIMNYDAEFAGDFDNFTLNFTTQGFTGVQRVNAMQGSATGIFQIAGATNPPPRPPTHHQMFVTRHYLDVIDFTDPSHPVVRKPVNIPGTLVGLSHQGGVVYTFGATVNELNQTGPLSVFASAYDGVAVYLIDSTPAPARERTIMVGADLFFAVLQPTNAVERWKLSGAGVFEKLATTAVGEQITSLEFKAPWMLATSDLGIFAFDITDPSVWVRKVYHEFDCLGRPRLTSFTSGPNELWVPFFEYGLFKVSVP